MHVGLPKTGTTHVQTTLAANRGLLTEQGLLYPRVSRHPQHFLAVLDFLQIRFGAVGPEDVAGLWGQLKAAVDEWPGRALISHELLAGATSADVERLVGELAPRPVHAIVTVRDLSRLLPAVWQERAKNRVVERWADFRTAVASGPDAAEAHPFWWLHDAEKVIRTWQQHIPDDRIHVVTLPTARADEDPLIDRFCQVIGIDHTGFTVAGERANESLGGLELAALRELNSVAAERFDRAAYTSLVKRFLVPQVLAKRPGQIKVTLPEADRAWVEACTSRIISMLTQGHFDVVGTLADLTPSTFAADDLSDPAQTGEFEAALVAQALAEVTLDVLALPAPRGARPGRPAVRPADGAVAGAPVRRARAVARAIRHRLTRRG